MKKVIIMRGLPGSGKSTYAKKLLAEMPNSYKRINRDDLRAMFDNGHFSKGNEKFVKQVRDLLIMKALGDGKHVIVDDTNLAKKNIERIKQLVDQHNKLNRDNVAIEVKTIDTPLLECIARDALRAKPVGRKVITSMYKQFFDKGVQYTEQDENLPKAIICDIDGTLALIKGRSPFDGSKCEQDLPNKPVVDLVNKYFDDGYKILLLSGRQDTYKEETKNWLKQHNIRYSELHLRKAEDNRKDSIVKEEIYTNHCKGKFNVHFVLDDRDQVVDLWRNVLKLPCFQVYYGDF